MAFDQNKPLSNGTLSSADMRSNFQHLKAAIAKEHNWSDGDSNASSHKLDAINMSVSGSQQRDIGTGYDYTTGAGNITMYVGHSNEGVGTGGYSLQGLLQELVNRSHYHSIERQLSNCNCNCDCGGNN